MTYNLIHRPWIPCVGLDGKPVELGLRDVLVRSHELLELGGESPLVTFSLARLLLAVLHAAYRGPSGRDAWVQVCQAGRWDAARIDSYLDHWAERFDLFHPTRPFYQAADKRVKPKTVAALIHHRASGNNATLFDHTTDQDTVALTPAEAARYLVTAQAFGLAGLSGIQEKFTHAPCVGGILFLVEGDTLFETLLLNWLRYDRESPFPQPGTHPDMPCWEMDNPFRARSRPYGYLDYLTWMNRRILLFLEESTSGNTVVRQMTVAPGLRMDGDVLNPMMHYQEHPKRGLLPLRFREDRALWRDSAALFELSAQGRRPPLALEWLARLAEHGYLESWRIYRLLAGGMASTQAKVEFYRMEHMPLPLAYLRNQRLVGVLRDNLQLAEKVAGVVERSADRLAELLLQPFQEGQDRQALKEDRDRLLKAWNVTGVYWAQLELPFFDFMETLPHDQDAALRAWRTVLRNTAREAFERAAAQVMGMPRGWKALVQARGLLEVSLARTIPQQASQGMSVTPEHVS